MNSVDVFRRDPQWSPARHQHGQVRHLGQERADLPGVLDEALESVEHQQHRRATGRPRQLFAELGGAVRYESQRRRRFGHEDVHLVDAVQIDVHRATGEALGHRPGGLHGEAGLADAAGPDERHQSHARTDEQLAHVLEVAAAPDRLGCRGGESDGEQTAGPLGGQVRILGEDHVLELAQLRPRLEPELAHHAVAAGAHRLERFCLASRPVQGDHQVGAQPLPQWMLADEALQLSDEVGIPPPRQVGGQAFLDRFETQLLESGDLPVGEVVEPMLRQHIPAPECQRLVQISGCAFGVVATESRPRSLKETLEAPCVDRQRVDLQRIAGRPMM